MSTGFGKRLVPAALLAALACGPGGCNEFSRNTDWQYGAAYHKVFDNQKLNPDAGAEGTPVTGYDGQKAVNTMGQYQNKPKSAKSAAKGGSGGGTTINNVFGPGPAKGSGEGTDN